MTTKKQYAHLHILWMCIFFNFSCSVDKEASPDQAYVFVKPDNFPEPTYTFQNNPVTKDGFELGKKLFFDPTLSRDGSVSCNNCHIQGTAFADSQQHPLSVGVNDQRGIRNAPSLVNLAFMEEFFWDGGVTHLDFVPINAIESDFEMDETLANVVKKLNADPVYLELFNSAFGIDKITSPYLLHALSQFTVMMVSSNSKYDKHMRGEGETLTSEELEGMEIFSSKCGSCHSGELFSDFSFRNNGINDVFSDIGRAGISEFDGDVGKFRVPSLRNVALTSPYMHNAKFNTLEEVLDHYENGVIDSPSLDEELKNGSQLGIPLSEQEKEKVIAFLKTLTDREFISDTRFMNR